MRQRIAVVIAAAFVLAASPRAEDAPAAAKVRFAAPPAVTKAGAEVTIAFELSARGDVEVAILDASGRVVRHLAAGVLGAEKAPPPPLKAGLKQSLVWDGKDDFEKPVADAAACKVRVRAGSGVKFGRIIGASPYTGSVTNMPFRAPVGALAVDAERNLYVHMKSDIGSHGNSGLWPWHLRKFDAEGKYLKTLLPYPPSTPPEKAHGVSLLPVPGGAFTPANQNSLYPVFGVVGETPSWGNDIANRLLDGQLVFVHSEAKRLNLFKLDGSNAIKTVSMFVKDAKVKCPAWLDVQVAFSPDGRFAYYSNLAGTPYDGKEPKDVDPEWPQGRIYRQDLTKEGEFAKPFYDMVLPDFAANKYWIPSAWDKKSAAAGVDVDAKCNVLACDLVNMEVVEISADGKKLGAIKVDWPDKVVAARKSDSVYVVSRAVSRGSVPPGKLIKYSGRGSGAKALAELALPGTMGGSLALDESGEKPVLYVAGGGPKGPAVWKIEDRGAELAVANAELINRDEHAIEFVGYMDVDVEKDLVYVTASEKDIYRFDGATGEGGKIKITGADLAVGWDGRVYTFGQGGWHGKLFRYDRDLNPNPIQDLGKNEWAEVSGRHGRGTSICGIEVDRWNRVFVTDGSNFCHVRAYDEAGKPVDFPQSIERKVGKETEMTPVAIDQVSGYGGSVRVDFQGNIYVLQYSVPKGFKVPAGFEKDEAYNVATGTILKFGPKGGKRLAKLNEGGRGGDPLGFENVLAKYAGCAPISAWRCAGSCACTKPRFDVDGYGRVFIPNAMSFTVQIVDNAGNEVISFGNYGNYDSQGPASSEPKPEFPLGWPITVGVGAKYIYVGDCLNHRILRADWTHSAEAVVNIK